MTLAYIASLALCSLVTTLATDVTSQFEQSFGSRNLNASFGGSSDSLGRALDHENKRFDAMDLLVSNVFACASYNDGQATASDFRNNQVIQLTPFYINEDDDTMCFIIRSENGVVDTKMFPMMQFLEQIPSSLKIENIIYSILDNFNSTNSPLVPVNEDGLSINELVVSLFPNKMLSPSESTSFAAVLTNQILEKLATYKLDEFTDFYWQVAAADTDSVPPEELHRIDQWGVYAQTLSIETPTLDPCGFGSLVAIIVDSNIVIPVDGLLSIRNSELAASCFAFTASGFAHDASVSHVALSIRPELLNYRSRSIQQSGSVGFSRQQCPYTAAGLTGAGQVVGISDTGLDEKSCFFSDLSGQVTRSLPNNPVTDMGRRKVVQYTHLAAADTSDVTNGHGTHVTGTVVGNNRMDVFSDGKLSGVAPEAKVAFFDIGTASGVLYGPSVQDTYPPMRRAGAMVFTNSWGGQFNGAGFYSGQQIDEYLYNNMDTVILFANGNSGEQGSGTVTSQASAKNVIGVGACESTFNSQSIDNVAYFSSQGPTYDGRIKPEIVAPGMAVESVRSASAGSGASTCETMAKSGTSMASPSAAGSALLIRQFFSDSRFWLSVCTSQCNAFTPSGVLIKAVLLHSGKAMSKYHNTQNVALGAPPDNMQGYGRVTLSEVLPLSGVYTHNLYVQDLVRIVENRQSVFKFTVTDSSQPFKVTISWYDPPGVSNSAKALIHDLDLVVYSPNRARTYYGNGKSSADRVNNNEQVYVENPPQGLWKVFVYARALPYSGDQLFSIVVTHKGSVSTLSNDDANTTSIDDTDDTEVFPQPADDEASVSQVEKGEFESAVQSSANHDAASGVVSYDQVQGSGAEHGPEKESQSSDRFAHGIWSALIVVRNLIFGLRHGI